MDKKVYRLYGINMAIEMLRPGAKWEWTGGVGFTRWDDPRTKPAIEEIEETMEKIRAFEDSVKTIYLPEQLEKIIDEENMITEAIGESNGAFC